MKNPLLLLPLVCIIACNADTSENDIADANADTIINSTDTLVTAPDAPALSGPQFFPIDEAPQDPSFEDFRDQLLEAIRKKDKEYILSIVHPQAHLSFGATEGGKSGFNNTWFNNTNDSPLWPILEIILKNGGTFLKYEGQKNKEFSAPYVFSAWPDTLDAFLYDVIISPDAPIYAQADSTSEIVAKGNYHIVKKDHDKSIGTLASENQFPHMLGHKQWIYISNFNEEPVGYIHWKNIWSPVGYRVIFSKENNKWLLRVLIAGD